MGGERVLLTIIYSNFGQNTWSRWQLVDITLIQRLYLDLMNLLADVTCSHSYEKMYYLYNIYCCSEHVKTRYVLGSECRHSIKMSLLTN